MYVLGKTYPADRVAMRIWQINPKDVGELSYTTDTLVDWFAEVAFPLACHRTRTFAVFAGARLAQFTKIRTAC